MEHRFRFRPPRSQRLSDRKFYAIRGQCPYIVSDGSGKRVKAHNSSGKLLIIIIFIEMRFNVFALRLVMKSVL